MKVSVRLVATTPGQDPTQRFVLSSGEGKTADDQTTVWEHLKMRLSVEGLTYGTTPSGMITMRIPASKLSADLQGRLYQAARMRSRASDHSVGRAVRPSHGHRAAAPRIRGV